MALDFAAAVARMDVALESVFGNSAGTLNGASVSGIYKRPGTQSMDVAVHEPTFRLRADVAPGVQEGDQLVIDAGTFRVREVQPDGTGWTTLVLARIA